MKFIAIPYNYSNQGKRWTRCQNDLMIGPKVVSDAVQVIDIGSVIAQNDSRCRPRSDWQAQQCFETEFVQIVVSDQSPEKLSGNTEALMLHSEDPFSSQYHLIQALPYQVGSSCLDACQLIPLTGLTIYWSECTAELASKKWPRFFSQVIKCIVRYFGLGVLIW